MANRYDVNIQIVPAAAYTGSAFYSFGQKRSLGVRGVNKLINMFARLLLTPVGTDSVEPTSGTVLTGLIGSNVTLSDAQEILQTAVATTVDAMQAFQAGRGVPDDERLASAEVTQFLLVEEAPGFAAQILVRNVANQGLSLVLPSLTVVSP